MEVEGEEGEPTLLLPHLPAELWSHVLGFVGGCDLVAFSATNRWAHALAACPFIWRSKVEERAGHRAGESEEQAWREADGATSWQQAWVNLERKCHRVRCGGCRRGPIDGPLFKCLTCSERLNQEPDAPSAAAAAAASTTDASVAVCDDGDDRGGLGDWYFCRNCEGDHPREHLLKKMRVREADMAMERCSLRLEIRPIRFTTDSDEACFLCRKEIHGPCYVKRMIAAEFKCMDCYKLLEDNEKQKYIHCSVPIVDTGYFCNGCRAGHIKGIRWKCMQCPDFDFCEACEAEGVHALDHAFLKVTSPKFNAGFLRHVMTPEEEREWMSSE